MSSNKCCTEWKAINSLFLENNAAEWEWASLEVVSGKGQEEILGCRRQWEFFFRVQRAMGDWEDLRIFFRIF